METIGLRELNQNPSAAVSRVRAGESIVVTDRGTPVLRMVPETERSSAQQRLLDAGEMQPPATFGMPETVIDSASDETSLADLLIGERSAERKR